MVVSGVFLHYFVPVTLNLNISVALSLICHSLSFPLVYCELPDRKSPKALLYMSMYTNGIFKGAGLFKFVYLVPDLQKEFKFQA